MAIIKTLNIMEKRIWIVNYHTSSPELASNPRYLQFAHHFQKAGYEVITFNASVKHGTDIDLIPDGSSFFEKDYGEYKFVHVKSPHYTGNGIKRMLSLFVFAMRLYFGRKKFPKPDIVLHNIHTPFDYPIVWIAKSLNAKYVAEAWDLWPEDFVTFGLVSRNNPILKLFYWLEKQLYYHADEMIFTFEGIYDYLDKKKWTKERGGKIDLKRVHYINNGIDLEEFDRNKITYPRTDEDMNDAHTKKIIYLGSIRLANHVKTLIDAASLLRDKKDYKFFIYGDGIERESLEKYVKDNDIFNVVFKEKRIDYAECAWVVSQATVNVMNYEKGFGHLGVSSGKMWQYLAAGKPIVCNIDIAYDDVITENNLGVARDIHTAEDFAREIVRIADLPKEEYDAMCERVRAVARDFDYKVLAQREISVLEGTYK